jgi:hypothetical protein
MVPATCASTPPVPPPSDRRGVARCPTAPHLTALPLGASLHALTLCRLAVRAARRRGPPPLPAGPGGAPRTYAEEALLLIALLRARWRLSYQDRHDWLAAWPALAEACGLPPGRGGRPRVPSPSQQWKRAALRRRLVRARDLISDSAAVLAWRRRDPDAASGHAPAHHPTPWLRGYRASSSWPPPTSTTAPSPAPCSPGRRASTPSARASSAGTRPTGGTR